MFRLTNNKPRLCWLLDKGSLQFLRILQESTSMLNVTQPSTIIIFIIITSVACSIFLKRIWDIIIATAQFADSFHNGDSSNIFLIMEFPKFFHHVIFCIK